MKALGLKAVYRLLVIAAQCSIEEAFTKTGSGLLRKYNNRLPYIQRTILCTLGGWTGEGGNIMQVLGGGQSDMGLLTVCFINDKLN